MPSWREFLYRYLPAGTPGAAAPAGVPADRRAEASAELAPVFALLADTEHAVATIRADAAETARRRVDDARRQARALVAQARDRAPAERALAATTDVDEADSATPDEVAATRIREQAAERMPAMVERALALVTHVFAGQSVDGAR